MIFAIIMIIPEVFKRNFPTVYFPLNIFCPTKLFTSGIRSLFLYFRWERSTVCQSKKKTSNTSVLSKSKSPKEQISCAHFHTAVNQIHKFRSDTQIEYILYILRNFLSKNWHFVQKSKFCPKIDVFFEQLKFFFQK